MDPGLTALARPAVRLHPVAGAGAAGTTRTAVDLVLPSGLESPCCPEHGTALIGVLEIARSDAALLPWPTGSDVLQARWCPHAQDHENESCPHLHLHWTSRQQVRDGRPPSMELPANGIESYVIARCRMVPEPVMDLPRSEDLPPELRARVLASPDLRALTATLTEELDAAIGAAEEDEDEELRRAYVYDHLLGAAPGWKLGGWGDWIQAPHRPACACGTVMDLVLTIASRMDDGFSSHRWRPRPAPAGYDGTGLMLGDMGSIHVFHCVACRIWDWRFSCS